MLSGLNRLKIATRYEVEGETWTHMPENIRKARLARPVYEEVDGWNADIGGVRSFDDLPAAARAYLRRLEDLTGWPRPLSRSARTARKPSCCATLCRLSGRFSSAPLANRQRMITKR